MQAKKVQLSPKFRPYFYPLQKPKNFQSVDSKEVEPQVSRKRIMTQTFAETDDKKQSQLPSIRKPTGITKQRLKLPSNLNLKQLVGQTYLKTDMSMDTKQKPNFFNKVQQPQSTKGRLQKLYQRNDVNRTLNDEYEDYANHVNKNQEIQQNKQQRKVIYMDSKRIKSTSDNFFNIYREISPIDEKKQIKKHFMLKHDFTSEEWLKYGDRFPKNYERVKILGRGGFSIIWLSQSKISKSKYAIKQIPLSNQYKTYKNELTFCEFFFDKGRIKQQFISHPGAWNLAKLIKYEITNEDSWLFYEIGGVSLGSQLYDFQSETFQDKHVYKLKNQHLSNVFRENKSTLYTIVIKLAESIDLLSQFNIIHSDIKSENILLLYNPDNVEEEWTVKLIDYGSSFNFKQLQQQFSMATPEYMCPELLNFILQENGLPCNQFLLSYLGSTYNKSWVIDVWGLGCVLLEIVCGIPLWMSLETLVKDSSGNQKLDIGLFAVKGRVFDKIIEKQLSISQNLKKILKNSNYSGIEVDQTMFSLLEGMLQVNPKYRIHPKQIIKICLGETHKKKNIQ